MLKSKFALQESKVNTFYWVGEFVGRPRIGLGRGAVLELLVKTDESFGTGQGSRQRSSKDRSKLTDRS